MGTQMEDRAAAIDAALMRRGSLLSLMPITMDSPGGDRSHSGPVSSFHFEGIGSEIMRTMTSRRWSDRRRQIAGRVLAMCADQQKAIALAQDWTDGWVSKLVTGRAGADAYLRVVDRMQRSRKTEAGPLAAAPLAEMARVVAETFTDVELVDALDTLLLLEAGREGKENEASTRLMLAMKDEDTPAEEIAALEDEIAQLYVEEVSAQLLLVAVLWERGRRRVLRVN